MSNNELMFTLLAIPLVASLLTFACQWVFANKKLWVSTLHTIAIVLLLVCTFYGTWQVYAQGEIFALGNWFHIDSLAALFMAILGLIGFMTGLHSIGYMNHELAHGEVSEKTLCNYYGLFHLFLFTMLLAITSNNLILLWAAVEATTISSAFLVAIYGKRTSLEAGWKYIIICTVGVAFGLYATILVYANAVQVMPDPNQAIFYSAVLPYAKMLDPTLMKLAFVFALIGFGTKTGLFPMHAWLPDAHSEAASPTSALLSAVLLNCALLIIIRFHVLVSVTIGSAFSQHLLLIFGFLSVAVAAFLILVQRDMKRLLAYSSVENMGLIALALGIGGPLGTLAAMLHTLNHSLAKTLLFCGSGNVLLKYGSRDLNVVKGVLRLTPVTGALLAGGALALGGMPPFNVFLSELLTVTAGIQSGHPWLTGLLLILLTIVLAGLVRMIAKAILGPCPDSLPKGELGWLTTTPMALLLALMLLMGTHIPHSVSQLLTQASQVVMNVESAPQNLAASSALSSSFSPSAVSLELTRD